MGSTMQEKLQKLRRINPIKNGVPKNEGNCQWCALEGARLLLENAEPREIPSYREGANDPMEDYIEDDYQTVYKGTRQEFFSSLKDRLQSGELMLVNLDNEFDHAYIIYREEDKYHLIDPDRQIFVVLKSGDDFIQKVTGWKNVDTIDYASGAKNPDGSVDRVNMTVTLLNHDKLNEKPLPIYSGEDRDKPKKSSECRIL